MKHWITLIVVIVTIIQIRGQGVVLPLGNDAYRILERLEIKYGLQSGFHSNIKTFDRNALTTFALNLDTASFNFSENYRKDLQFIYLDNNEWLAHEKKEVQKSKSPLLKHFYKTPANLLETNHSNFYLRAYPMLHLSLGSLKNEEDPYYLFNGGFELRGGIAERVYFYFNLLESQAHYPEYVDQLINERRNIPGQGAFEFSRSRLFGFENGYRFLNGQGYLGFNLSEHVGVQLGRGRNFIGNGYRSLFLSDFSNNYSYLKLNWKIWKFHYQNIFAKLSATPDFPGEENPASAKKYIAAHYLSYNASKNFNISIFEVVVFNRDRHFELQYLNPLIFYRTVEQAIGSPDNVLLGAAFKWNFLRHFQMYGQLIFDEIKFDELTAGNGWWGNKFGIQAGLKYIDAFGIDHLDFQLERNLVRPYTYTHNDSLGSYTHFNQPLAHPLGANFRETVFLASYQPFPKLTLNGRIIMTDLGEDEENINWGHNLLRSNRSRHQEYGNEVGQGVNATIFLAGFDLSYRLAHNIFLDAYYFYRKKDSETDVLDITTQMLGGGIRVNISKQRMDF